MVACEQHKDDLVQLMAEEKQDKIKKEENRKRKDYLQLLNVNKYNNVHVHVHVYTHTSKYM